MSACVYLNLCMCVFDSFMSFEQRCSLSSFEQQKEEKKRKREKYIYMCVKDMYSVQLIRAKNEEIKANAERAKACSA